MPETPTSTIEQDIAQLERQIQEKKAMLGHQAETGKLGEKNELLPSPESEKEILRTVLGEKIQQQIPQYQPAISSAKAKSDGDLPSYLSQELKDKVQELVNIVFGTSLEDGIRAAVKENNPALIDAFHDILVDEFYNTLLERKKIEKIE